VFWVADEAAEAEVLAEESLPFFTTPHFDGHPSAAAWLAERGLEG